MKEIYNFIKEAMEDVWEFFTIIPWFLLRIIMISCILGIGIGIVTESYLWFHMFYDGS